MGDRANLFKPCSVCGAPTSDDLSLFCEHTPEQWADAAVARILADFSVRLHAALQHKDAPNG